MQSALEWAASAQVRSAYERAALVALAQGVSRQSGARAALHGDLALTSGMSVPTLKRTLKALASPKRGLIAIHVNHRRGEGSVYVLTGWLRLRGIGETIVAGGADVTDISARHIDHSDPSSAAEMDQSDLGSPSDHGSHRPSSERSMGLSDPPHSSLGAVIESPHNKDKTLEPPTVNARSLTLRRESQADRIDLPPPDARARAKPLLTPQALFDRVNHPLLDPDRAPQLMLTAGRWLDSWRHWGASDALIAAVVTAVTERHARRKPGDQITTLNFFSRAIGQAIAEERRAAAAAEEGPHERARPPSDPAAGAGPSAGVVRLDPTERERARTLARQDGWTAALAIHARSERGPA
jgi:hypothetical protein